jgi:signal transduction histidine kinase
MKGRIESDYFQLKEYTENMSHELQTPLSIIQVKSESLLSENNLSHEQAKKIKVIYNEIQQLSKLGSALNLITKIENLEFQNIKKVKTAPVIRDHVEKIEEIAGMKQLQVETELEEDHAFSIDPGLLDILIRNLVKNALRYAREGSSICIKTREETLEITNEGGPLDFPEKEIFSRFKRGNGSHSVGLGLAIAKKICTVSQLDIQYMYQQPVHSFRVLPMKDNLTGMA